MKISINLVGLEFDQAAAFLANSFSNGGGEEAACIACSDGPIEFVRAIREELGVELQPEISEADLIGGMLANRVTEIQAEANEATSKEDKAAVIYSYLYP